jgi:hypothetical protein
MIEDRCWIGYELDDLLHATTTHTAIAAGLDCAPWWLHTLDLTRNCLQQYAFPSHTALVTNNLTIGPVLMCLDLGWIPQRKCASTVAGKCALVIPPSKSTDKGLKLSTLGSSEIGRKDFPGSDLMISQEPQMCPPQLSHPQWLSNAPKMISLSESDEKPGNRSVLPSSQLSRRGIIGFSLTGTSRINLMLSSCTLYLDKCTLNAANWIIVVEVRWKIWMIFPVTRACLSTLKSTSGCLPPRIRKALGSPKPEMRLSPQLSSQILHNDELGRFTFSYSCLKP